MAFVEYNSIDVTKVKTAELIPVDDPDYQSWKRTQYQKESKTQGQKERDLLIKGYPGDFRRFKEDFEYAYRNPEKLAELISNFVSAKKYVVFEKHGRTKYGKKHAVRSPFHYYHARQPIEENFDWAEVHYTTEQGEDGRITVFDTENLDDVKEVYRRSNWDVKDELEPVHPDDYGLPDAFDSFGVQTLENMAEVLRTQENEDDLRKYIHRYCFHEHLEEACDKFNIQRCEAFLRDLHSDVAQEANNPGKQAYEFEKQVRESISDLGFPLKNRVFECRMKSGKTRYKEMDIHTQIGDWPVIIEVFTSRKFSEKKQQVKDYKRLYRRAERTGAVPLLLTTGYQDTEELSEENLNQKISDYDGTGVLRLRVDKKRFQQ